MGELGTSCFEGLDEVDCWVLMLEIWAVEIRKGVLVEIRTFNIRQQAFSNSTSNLNPFANDYHRQRRIGFCILSERHPGCFRGNALMLKITAYTEERVDVENLA